MPASNPTPVRGAAARRAGRPTRQEAARLDRDVRECALRLFLEYGYEGTSMEAIARAAGTTKASLYARYAGKQEIFSSVLTWATGRPDWPVADLEPPDLDDLEGALTAIGNDALRRALDPSAVKLGRIAIAQASRFPDIARQTQSEASWPGRQTLIDLLDRHAAAGTIVADDPDVLARHFLAMVAGMPARLASFGIVRDPERQRRDTVSAVQLFLRSLHPEVNRPDA